MPYWKWSDWERLIDWMALNGITMPLAISGQETVWYKVWSKLGLNDEQIRSYFTGPAHLPWHRMSNVDYWQSPLPKSWLEQQEVLQKQILKRERDFNMTPVLPAFSGHVPKELKAIYPDAAPRYSFPCSQVFSQALLPHILLLQRICQREVRRSFKFVLFCARCISSSLARSISLSSRRLLLSAR